ncbi:shiftless antiviral inhibitor of ribosomal frameshifting protein homolog [Scleropages formosus]|uniref:Shiftless antiviral inhibitor of ribosomal frameshifting n=1 Tax=Scleropages formosus TaxID=113540 RepID=A0A8C9VPK3_SCLFO|nr:repressor of yield of DENV protein [Scleropages formosus]
MNRQHAEVELEKSVRRLREKFHGKIPVNKATILMRRYGNNHRIVAMDIILMKDRELDEDDQAILQNDEAARNVVQRLEAEEREEAEAQARQQPSRGEAQRAPREDQDITELASRLRVLPLTRENLRMFDNAQRNVIPSDLHQFACQLCDFDWWRRVPQRKMVSRCQKCKRKYDPVPEDRRWGIAEFHCPNCARTFKGFGQMNLGSPCYTCHSLVTPTQILPPRRKNIGLGNRRQNPHSCLAEDCYNRQEPHVPGTECIHPRSRLQNHKPRVVYPSLAHVSSGSTVNTCLSQGSLMDLYQIILDDIREERGAEIEEDGQEEDESNTETNTSSSSSSRI